MSLIGFHEEYFVNYDVGRDQEQSPGPDEG